MQHTNAILDKMIKDTIGHGIVDLVRSGSYGLAFSMQPATKLNFERFTRVVLHYFPHFAEINVRVWPEHFCEGLEEDLEYLETYVMSHGDMELEMFFSNIDIKEGYITVSYTLILNEVKLVPFQVEISKYLVKKVKDIFESFVESMKIPENLEPLKRLTQGIDPIYDSYRMMGKFDHINGK